MPYKRGASVTNEDKISTYDQTRNLIKTYNKSSEYLTSSKYNSNNLNLTYLLLKYDNNLFKTSISNLLSLINQADTNFDSNNLDNIIDSNNPYTLQIIDSDNITYSITVENFLSLLYETPSVTNITEKNFITEDNRIIIYEGDEIKNITVKEFYDSLYETTEIINITENTYNNIDNSKLILNFEETNYNLTINTLFLILFRYNNLNISSLTSTSFDNYYISIKNGTTINNITFNNLFLLFYKYAPIDIENIDIGSFIFSLNYGTNIYNITLNKLFLLLFQKTTNIDFTTSITNISEYKIAINNSTTNYNITVNHLFKYLDSIINPSTSTSTTNIESSFVNNNIILKTTPNVSFDTITITSDIRFKTNIKTIKNDDCLNKIDQLEPKEFYYKSNTKKKQYGLIAQDLLETDISDIVDETDSEHYKINYNNLFGLLIGSIKELTKEIQEVKNENIELKNLIRKTYEY